MVVVIVCPGRTHVDRPAVGRPEPVAAAGGRDVRGRRASLSSLFAGPGAGTAGAPLLVFGHNSLAASAAAGLELSITTLIAGVLLRAWSVDRCSCGALRQARA